MRLRLQESLEQTVASRAHELEAQNFALQFQMNPHFLYNTITNISILAEEADQMTIVAFCQDLSSMLRYISSHDTSPVRLAEELEHTTNYINLMKLRYEDNIEFHVDIPKQLQIIYIPKLIIQPFVENAFKYGIHVNPPWIISITSQVDNHRWKLIIRDNGQGFQKNHLQQLKHLIAITDPYHRIPNLKINGMGLINVYARLKLLYNNHCTLDIDNHPAGGAVITIIVNKEVSTDNA
ncbi:sensor histidine kinase [Paenibacillus alba]|uniref:Histidine kinase n=1 Tax=Paenibacillus alba TaxID=1197127 RepID=A0ABU6FX40_9BACL|nr:histidine kinase [Paenibacillus alba]MEC0226474.1 histidine kinase [Paenibacillus alba]